MLGATLSRFWGLFSRRRSGVGDNVTKKPLFSIGLPSIPGTRTAFWPGGRAALLPVMVGAADRRRTGTR